MTGKDFDLENAYIEIFLTKVISKEDLFDLLTSKGITFDENFNLEKASQFDLGVILMNDFPNEKLLPKISILQKDKYSDTKSLKEISDIIDEISNLSEIEIAKYYIQISDNEPMKKFTEDFVSGKNKASNSIYKNDLLFSVTEALLKAKNRL